MSLTSSFSFRHDHILLHGVGGRLWCVTTAKHDERAEQSVGFTMLDFELLGSSVSCMHGGPDRTQAEVAYPSHDATG